MSPRYLIQGALVLIALCILLSGCARKPIVRPDVPQPQMAAPYPPGMVGEQDLQVVQTNLKTLYFEFDKYTLTPESFAALQYDAEVLNRAPQLRVVAEGHCDERGTSEYNLALGERRARAVVEQLAALGVAPARLSTVSYGSELPADPAHNEQAWAKNRRVYLRVVR